MLQRMKFLKKIIFAALISFSVFCFYYVNSQKPESANYNTSILNFEDEEQTKDQDIYLPDGRLIKKIVDLAQGVLRVL